MEWQLMRGFRHCLAAYRSRNGNFGSNGRSGSIGADSHMTTSLVLSEHLMVLTQAISRIYQSEASPSAASRTNPLPPRLTQHRLEAVVAAVSVPIEEGHVIILHIPVGIHHRSVGW